MNTIKRVIIYSPPAPQPPNDRHCHCRGGGKYLPRHVVEVIKRRVRGNVTCNSRNAGTKVQTVLVAAAVTVRDGSLSSSIYVLHWPYRAVWNSVLRPGTTA